MMRTPREIEELTTQALTSLDNLQPVEANPFLYQKIKHRMVQSRQAAARHAGLMVRLSAALLLFLCINVASFYFFSKKQQPVKAKTTTGINAVGDEFFPKTDTYNY